MNIYIWRHNRKFHSYSMIDEPCVNQNFYTDAIAIVLAESLEQAYQLLEQQNQGWIVAELARLEPRVFAATEPAVLYQEVRGN